MITEQEHLNRIHLRHGKRKANKNGYHYQLTSKKKMVKVNHPLPPLQMLKTVLIVQQKQQQLHRKELVVAEVHVVDVEEVVTVLVVLMLLHRKKVEKIERLPLQQPLLINKLTTHTKIIMHIIVSEQFSFNTNNKDLFQQTTIQQVKVVMELHGIMINKINEKRKLKDHLVSIRMHQLEMQQVNNFFHFYRTPADQLHSRVTHFFV